MKISTSSTEQTIQAGRSIAAELVGGDIVLLEGDLGAGKTTLTKGILSYFDVDPNSVVSPTFTLLQEYNIRNTTSNIQKVIHVDTYRLESQDDLVDLGIEDYLGEDDTVAIVEWPEKIEPLLEGKKTISLRLDHGDGETRTITKTAD